MRFPALGFALVFFGTCSVAGSASAQTIYRCGHEYTRIPCPDGKPLESLEPRTAAQRTEARRRLIDGRSQGAAVETDRLRKEAALKAAPATSLSAAPASAARAASAPKKPFQKKRWRKVQVADADRDFIAGVPGGARNKYWVKGTR